MSEPWRTFYAMKRRRPVSMTRRDKLLAHRLHVCPGNVYHNHPRREILFRNRVNHGHACYVMYWRAHVLEYSETQDNCRQGKRFKV
jgi:hypothetical protein